jgi:low temperature requirement protein LtrA
VFGLIWVAWMNGTLYHELHGREDGRSRLYVFLQMLLLAVRCSPRTPETRTVAPSP